MKFTPIQLEGAYLIEVEQLEDSRGYFGRLWCREEFQQRGIEMEVAQTSISHNISAGTVRGMHFQWPPSREGKLVRCDRGSVYDVIVDLRPNSPTFTQHVAVELDSRKHNALYVPPGFAHGFQTLEDNSGIHYMMSDEFRPELADGVRFDDPQFSIEWPLPVSCIAERDKNYPDFDHDAYTKNYVEKQIKKL